MPEVLVFEDHEFPADFVCQVLAAHRIEWPDGYRDENRWRTWLVRPEFHPLHAVLVERGLVLSYAAVVRKRLAHAGEEYDAYGLSGVYTFPAFRGEGHGSRMVAAASERIRASEPDIGLFTCQPRHVAFYAAAGWTEMADAVLLGGAPGAEWAADARVMMAFFSDRGRAARDRFESDPRRFGGELW